MLQKYQQMKKEELRKIKGGWKKLCYEGMKEDNSKGMREEGSNDAIKEGIFKECGKKEFMTA